MLFPTTLSNADSVTMPSWINNIVKYKTEGHISDKEFVNALQYLLDNNIIQPIVNIEAESKDNYHPFVTIQMNKTHFKIGESIQIVIKNIGSESATFLTTNISNSDGETVFSAEHGIPEDRAIIDPNEKKIIQINPQHIKHADQYKIVVQYVAGTPDDCCRYVTVRTFVVEDSLTEESDSIKKIIDNTNKNGLSHTSLSYLIESLIEEKIINTAKWIEYYGIHKIEPKLIITKNKINYKTGDTLKITMKNDGNTDIIFDDPSYLLMNHETCCYDDIHVLKSGKTIVKKFIIPTNEYAQEVKRLVFAYHSPYEQENHFELINIIANP
ncbi:MAG: hypothetical protein HZC29_03125 [Thaumarchaeota archaeon]|nr:hypothetical protein [Nitrososphaerota archaeon]